MRRSADLFGRRPLRSCAGAVPAAALALLALADGAAVGAAPTDDARQPAGNATSGAVSGADEATPRERIAGYLVLYYVEDPNNGDPRYLPQRLDPAALLDGTEESDFWRDEDIPGLQGLVRDLVQEPPAAGVERFQRLVADLLDVRGKRVAVYLIDDAGQPLVDGGRVVQERYGASVDDAGTGVWPSAQDDRAMALSGSVLGGSFAAGEVNLRSAADARSTFLHELAHVQVRSDARPHLFTVSGRDYSYGLDGSHDGRELIADRSTAYDEAVAGALQMLYEPALAREAVQLLRPDGIVIIEKVPPAPTPQRGASVSNDIWLYEQLKEAGIPEIQTSDPSFVAYGVGDLPPRYLLHSATAMAVVLAESARRTVGPRGLLRALHRTNAVIEASTDERSLRASRLTVHELAVVLPALGREILGRDDPTAAFSSGGPANHLLPLALLDYITGRAAASEEEFGALLDGQLRREWLNAYWAVGRPRLDTSLPAASRAPRSWDDLERIAAAFATDAGPAVTPE